MPLDDFASKSDLERLEADLKRLKSDLLNTQRENEALKKQNTALVTSIDELTASISDGFVEIRGGEDIPTMQEIEDGIALYHNSLQRLVDENAHQQNTKIQKFTRSANSAIAKIDQKYNLITKKLENLGDISGAIDKELQQQLPPAIQELLNSEDNKIADNLKKDRVTFITSMAVTNAFMVVGVVSVLLVFFKMIFK